MGYEKHAGQKGQHCFMSADFGGLHDGRRQSQPGQPPDEQCVGQVDDQVNQMISPDIKTMKMIVKRKRQGADRTAGKKPEPVADAC